MSGFAALVPALAMATFLIFLIYLTVMKKQVEDAQDENDTTALAKSTPPAERNPSKRRQKDDVTGERINMA